MVDHHGGFDVDSCTNNVLSLCSGVGGLDIGFALGTFGRNRTICYVEREAYTCALLAKRMAEKTLDEAPIWTDVHTFDGRPWRGIVDSICGGYPCQPFSTAGKRHGANDPRHLWPSIVRIIEEIQPRIVFFENVSGHLTLGFDTVCQDLERLGFNVAAGLFSAAEIGAPHERQRLFIVGLAHGNSGHTGGACIDGRTTRHAQKSDDHACGATMAHAACVDGGQRKSNNICDAQCGSVTGMFPGHSCAGGTVANTDGYGHFVRNNKNQSTLPNVGANCIDMADTMCIVGKRCMASEERERLSTFEHNGGTVENADGIPLFPPGQKDFDMADTMSNGSQRIDETRTTEGTTKRGNRSEIPLFPPGPKDFGQWERILRNNPHCAPAIESEFHGMVDGFSNRVDRLRACGNAVFPLVAAYAFASLFPVVATNPR